MSATCRKQLPGELRKVAARLQSLCDIVADSVDRFGRTAIYFELETVGAFQRQHGGLAAE